MRIGIDAHYLGNRQSGNETYVRGLISGLASVDGEHEYTIYVSNREIMAAPPIVAPNIRYRFVGTSRLARVAAGLPMELLRHPVDVFHSHYVAPLAPTARLVLVMHDISFATMPHLFPSMHARLVAQRARSAMKQAKRVVVASDTMRDQVREYYCVPEHVLEVVPLGVSPRFRATDREDALRSVRDRYGTGDRFLLSVGDLQPRKNLTRLLEAFSTLVREGREEKLVIVGRKAWGFDEVFSAVEKLDLVDSVVFTGYVPEDDLVDLYNAAELFVYPSIYEGFGLPTVEAMAFGTPVIASDEPSLRETTASAALLFDPFDAVCIAESIRRGLEDEQWRKQARNAGFDRASSLSWDTCARSMLRVYTDVGGE